MVGPREHLINTLSARYLNSFFLTTTTRPNTTQCFVSCDYYVSVPSDGFWWPSPAPCSSTQLLLLPLPPTPLLPELPAAVNGRGPYVTTKITAPHGILTARLLCTTATTRKTPQLLQVHRNETALPFQGIPSSQPGPAV